MTGSIQLALGFAVLAVGLASTVWTVALTARFSRGGGAIESMMQRSFLPEKRRTYLSLLSLEGSVLLLGGLLWGATTADLIPESAGAMAVGLLLGVGMACVTGITWLGLRPSRLSPRQQAVLRNRALYSLVLAPMAAEAGLRGVGGAEGLIDG